MSWVPAVYALSTCCVACFNFQGIFRQIQSQGLADINQRLIVNDLQGLTRHLALHAILFYQVPNRYNIVGKLVCESTTRNQTSIGVSHDHC